MRFVDLTEEQKMARDGFRRFLENELQPVVDDYRGRYIPRGKMQEIFEQLVRFGIVTAPVPEKFGGLGLDWTTHGILYLELARISADIAVAALINAVGTTVLIDFADKAILEKCLPGVLQGKTFLAFGISEPDVGSNVVEIKSRARLDGDHYVINGEKTWVTNGDYADFFVCTARTSDDERHGLTNILLERDKHGYKVRNIKMLGLESTSTAQMFMDHVRVPIANRVGEEGEALKASMTAFEKARAHVALTSLGIAQRALEAAINYAQERRQHGKQIAGHQLIAAKLAEMATMTDTAHLLCMRTLGLLDRGVRCDMEASMAKWHTTEIAVQVAGEAIQIHGSNGITQEFPVEKLFRDAKTMTMPDGTTEIQKLLIARQLTGIAAFS